MWAFLITNVGLLSSNMGAEMKILLPALGFHRVCLIKDVRGGKQACKTKTSDH